MMIARIILRLCGGNIDRAYQVLIGMLKEVNK